MASGIKTSRQCRNVAPSKTESKRESRTKMMNYGY